MIIAPRANIEIMSSNVPQVEVGVDVWNTTTEYAAGSVVQINGTTNKKYKALQAVPINIDPLQDVNEESGQGTYWYRIGATNYYNAFDELASSKCIQADTIIYKFKTSDVDLLMLDGLVSQSVTVKVVNEYDGTTVLQEETYVTAVRDVFDWHDWTYEEAEVENRFFKLLKIGANTSLELTIDNTNGNAEVGHIAFGRSKTYGLTLIKPNPVATIRGVMARKRNEFGDLETRRGARYRRMKVTCIIDSSLIDVTENRLEKLADTPCIFVGDEREGGYRSLLIYGELKDHDLPISVGQTKYQIEVEGYI